MRKNKIIGFMSVLTLTAMLATGCSGATKANLDDTSANTTKNETQLTQDPSESTATPVPSKSTTTPAPTTSTGTEASGQTGKINIDAIVQLGIDKNVYASGDKLQLTVNNVGDSLDVSFGRAFKLELVEGETVTEVPLDLMFTEDLVIVEPGKNFTQEVELKDLKPGTYRISKNLFIENQETNSEMPAQVILQKDFTIE